jgi:sulfatase modifying factor 1
MKFEMKQSDIGYQMIGDGQLLCTFVYIPKGCFHREGGKTITLNSCFMAQFLVTQQLYTAVTGNNPSKFKGNQHPVEMVSWYDAVKFCGKLNKEFKSSEPFMGSELLNLNSLTNDQLNSFKVNPVSSGFRLPTEAEWKYAATGSHNPPGIADKAVIRYAGSNHLDLVGWYRNNNEYETRPVGLKFPNTFGLYDMSGNVWEWCWDWYGEYSNDKLDNPVGAKTGAGRADRGGSWRVGAVNCLVGYRGSNGPVNHGSALGLRLVFIP